jgi:hypothetical protein
LSFKECGGRLIVYLAGAHIREQIREDIAMKEICETLYNIQPPVYMI